MLLSLVLISLGLLLTAALVAGLAISFSFALVAESRRLVLLVGTVVLLLGTC